MCERTPLSNMLLYLALSLMVLSRRGIEHVKSPLTDTTMRLLSPHNKTVGRSNFGGVFHSSRGRALGRFLFLAHVESRSRPTADILGSTNIPRRSLSLEQTVFHHVMDILLASTGAFHIISATSSTPKGSPCAFHWGVNRIGPFGLSNFETWVPGNGPFFSVKP